MIKLNLVPAEILAKAQQKQQNLQIGIVVALVAMLLAGVSALHYYKQKGLEKELALNEAELKKLAVIVARVEELERTAAAVRQRLKVITDLLKDRPLYPYFMSDFVKTVPTGVLIKTLTTTNSSSSVLQLSITAESRTSEDIAAWIRAMEQTGKFSGEEMGAVSSSGLEAEKVFNFSLKATYTAKL